MVKKQVQQKKIKFYILRLKRKVRLLDNNIAEKLETPKIPKYLTLEQAVRLLIQCEDHPRDQFILTIFLNCALRLIELVNINVDQVNN